MQISGDLFDKADENIPHEISKKTIQKRKRVTLEWAAKVLARAAKFAAQRPIKTGYVQALKREMLGGFWRDLHPHGLIFDEKGILQDGYHRLNAVVEAGKEDLNFSTWMYINFRNRKEMAGTVDVGRVRNVTDSSRIDGGSERDDHGAAARKIEYGPKGSTIYLTPRQIKELIDRYWRGMPIVEQCRHKRVSATLKAVLARASMSPMSEKYMGREEMERVNVFQRLCEFIDILSTGLVENKEDRAAGALRRWNEGNKTRYTTGQLCKQYLASEIAVMTFMKKKPLTTIKIRNKDGYRNKELFPIPEDDQNPRFADGTTKVCDTFAE